MNNHLSKIQVANLIDEASQLNNEIEKTDKVSSAIVNVVGKLSTKSSEFLAGVLGAGIGWGGGFAISLSGFSMVYSGPIGMILGTAAFLLVWRGIGQHKIERLIQKFSSISAKVLNNIKSIPPNAPQYVTDNRWKAFDKISDVFEQEAIKALSDNSSKMDTIH